MRQSGVLAAAAIYALDHHVERLADDHANAKLLVQLLSAEIEHWKRSFVQDRQGMMLSNTRDATTESKGNAGQ